MASNTVTRDLYKLGARHALADLGTRILETLHLRKPEEDHTARNLLMGGAAATPFLGLIGQQKIKHNPLRSKDIARLTPEEIARQAKPGDVLLTGYPNQPYTGALTEGSPFIHAEPIVGTRRGTGVGVSASHLKGETGGLRQLQAKIPTLTERFQVLGPTDTLLLRPKKRLTAAQQHAYREAGYEAARQPYSVGRAVRSHLRNWFVPNISLLESAPNCVGNSCATGAAQTFQKATNQSILPRRSPKNIIASDFLRSDAYEPVAAHLSSKLSPHTAHLLHLGARGALGAGLAASVYGVSEDPALAAVPIGAMAAPALTRATLGYNTARPWTQLLTQGPKRAARFRNILGRTLPLTIAGGLGAYLVARQLRQKLTEG